MRRYSPYNMHAYPGIYVSMRASFIAKRMHVTQSLWRGDSFCGSEAGNSHPDTSKHHFDLSS